MTGKWYYKNTGKVIGPVSSSELLQAVIKGVVNPNTEVSQDSEIWGAASQVKGLLEQASKITQSHTADSLPPLPILKDLPSASTVASATRTNSFNDNLQVLDSASNSKLKVEVLGYKFLSGIKDVSTAQAVFFANQNGLQLKQVRITLNKGEAMIEAGALHFMQGQIEVENKIDGMAGIGKAVINKFIIKEATFMPRYRGTGEIYLEPSFGHFMIYQLNNEEIIVDKGMFYCSEGSLNVGVAVQKNISSALFGGEGFFQTQIKGAGICVFELPVPRDEVLCVHLNNETLKVDGNFALMRTGKIDFTVEKSTKGILGTLTSGEALLQTFRGTGKVWLAPTQSVYQKMRMGGITNLNVSQKSSHTST